VIYLDTHLVVWLYSGQVDLISPKVKSLVDQNDIFISPIVQLELQYLYETKRISVQSNTVVRVLEGGIGLKFCSKEFKKVVLFSLKQEWTRDPFDRIITAHASLDKNTLLTKDRTIQKHYKKAIW